MVLKTAPITEPLIIFEDRHLLVIQKFPGWLSQADGSSRPDVLEWGRKYLEVSGRKPGRAYIGLCHRLDLGAGGLMVLAKTSKAAQRLAVQFRERTVCKYYLALVSGQPPQDGHLEHNLRRAGDRTVLALAGEKSSRAVLEYETQAAGLWENEAAAMLKVKLITGFKHQIRAQTAISGFPIIGDSRYGGRLNPSPLNPAIGLWACRLELTHPVERVIKTFLSYPAELWPWSAWAGRSCEEPDDDV
ncbi:MAG: RNA pseudouridine synthase [Deltaproteobacteria bacterium]|jgi:23S rRNA pseudouridine1911/1915/1917 synthase|nr:RNA pseudouridine synthase [Deltaproteobacteria bacterium]